MNTITEQEQEKLRNEVSEFCKKLRRGEIKVDPTVFKNNRSQGKGPSINQLNKIWGTRFGYDDWDEYDTPGNR